MVEQRRIPVIDDGPAGCDGLEEESPLLDGFRCLDKPLRIGAMRHAFKDALGMK